MKKISLILLSLILILSLTNCDKYQSKVIVADYVTGSKYEIIEVDGGAVERIQHGLVVTRVPFVILEQGEHSLTLREWHGNVESNQSQTTNIFVNVKKGLRYKLVEKDGKAILIEEHK